MTFYNGFALQPARAGHAATPGDADSLAVESGEFPNNRPIYEILITQVKRMAPAAHRAFKGSAE